MTDNDPDIFSAKTLPRDLTAGLVVFLVALPLCLGVAVASGAPPFAGLLAGIIGGIVVGAISGSHSSVSGPAAGLTAIVYAIILGDVEAPGLGFDGFLLAVFLAGVFQAGMGIARAGALAAYFPLSVIKGLLAAIGLILIIKQVPYLIGYDKAAAKAVGEAGNHGVLDSLAHVRYGAALVGIAALLILIFWDRIKLLKKSPIPSALAVVVVGVLLHLALRRVGGSWSIQPSLLVDVPVAAFLDQLRMPDFTAWNSPAVYRAAFTIAIVASLETLLNLEAVDKIDPRRRVSNPNRELVAQGVGNMACGLVGALPVTSVIVRSSVNLNAGAETKRSAIFHGILLLGCVVAIPQLLNLIPLSCLAAILVMTGYKLASPKKMLHAWHEGWSQFLPFAATVTAILLTDLLIGVVIGLVIAIGFILRSNMRLPVRRYVENHVSGDVLRIELANQVSFLNRAALSNVFDSVPRGGHVLIDARNTDYIDNDVLALIREYHQDLAPGRGVEVSLLGFEERHQISDRVQFVDFSTRDLQERVSPAQVLEILKAGHARAVGGQRLTREPATPTGATPPNQFPLACVLTCIDSRTPTEQLFDLGPGDVYAIRVAGNILDDTVLCGMEYSCAYAGAKLVLVLGHTCCGAVNKAIELFTAEKPGRWHMGPMVGEIQKSIGPDARSTDREAYADGVVRRNVERTIQAVRQRSDELRKREAEGAIAIVGAVYDVRTGRVEFMG